MRDFDRTHLIELTFESDRLWERPVVKGASIEVSGLPDQTLTGTTEQIFDHSHLGEETRRDATISYTVTGGVPAPDDDTLTTETSYDAGGTTRSQRHSGSVQDKPKDPTYFYDASGQVIARKSETKTSYLFYFASGSRLAEEAGPDGSTRTRFLNAPGGKVLAEQRIEDSEWVWLLGDPDGNVATELKETSGDPEVKTQRAYDPYGSPDEGGTSDEPLTGPQSKSTLGYQSDNTDEDTGNLLLGPRLYDPEVNRFTSPDVFAAGGADMALGTDPLTGNRFMFAAANPVAFYEDGHRPERKMCARAYCSQASPANFQSADREASKVIMDPWQMSRTCAGDMSRMYQACMAFGSRFPNPNPPDVVGGLCRFLGPCAFIDAVEEGNYGVAAFELAMMVIPVGKVGKGAKLLRRADDAGDARTAARSLDDVAASCRANSFTRRTRVLMADGSSKRISRLRVGDFVLAKDPVTGESGERVVTDVIEGEGEKLLVDVEVDGQVLTATEGHPFWVDDQKRWVDAGALLLGDRLHAPSGLGLRVASLVERREADKVFNLTVDDIHTYYVVVGKQAVLVHNSGCTNLADLPADARLYSRHGDAFAHLRDHHGLSPHVAGDRLHAIKRQNELAGDFDVLIGPTGDVWNPVSGDLLGSLTQGY